MKEMDGFVPTDEAVSGYFRWSELLRLMAENGLTRIVRERDGESKEEFTMIYKSIYNAARARNAKGGSPYFCVSKRGDKIYVECWEVC